MRSLAFILPRSVRGRLWAALAILSTAVLVVSGLSWAALQRVDDRLQDLHRESLTRVAEAIELSKRSSDLVASAPYLLTQRSNYLIEEEGAKLIAVLETVRNDWPQEDAMAESASHSVPEITLSMDAGIRDLIGVAVALEALQGDLRRQVARLGNMRDVATDEIRTISGSEQSQMVWWILKDMNADMLNAAFAGNLIGVGEEQRYFQRQRQFIDTIDLDARQSAFLAELDDIATGPPGLFEQRRQELALQLRAQNALFRIRQDANGINAAASDYAARAEAVLTGERSASSTLIRITRVTVATISAASLGLALAATLFVSRYVALNIGRISEAMVRLANGDRSSSLPRHIGGQDEIGDLHRSYRFFRANALRLDRSNRKLDQRNALFEKVFANISDGVVITDATGHTSAQNPAISRIFRTRRKMSPKAPFVGWIHDGRFSASAKEVALGPDYRGVAELESDDGQILELRASALPDGGRVWLIADVTERRRLAERVEQIDRIETLGKVAGDTAHDFANVLSTIRTHAHLLQKETPAPMDVHVAAIENAVEFGTSLSDRLLAFSRKQRLAPEVIELNKLVEGLIDLAEIGLRHGVKLQVSSSKAPLQVLADPGQMESALLNLILNANSAIEGKGTIDLKLSLTDGGEAQIIVADDGCGMSPDVRLRAIEPFFTTRQKEGGTGLGLSIVYGFIRQSGGTFDIESQEGRYTKIKITLPIATSRPTPKSHDAHRRALILDDNPMDLSFAVDACKALGLECRAASSIAEAREFLEDQEFDLVLSDQDLGVDDADGTSFLHWVSHRCPETLCILVSGRSQGQASGLGPIRFVSKPVTVDALRIATNTDQDGGLETGPVVSFVAG